MQIFVMKNDERLGPFSLEEVNRHLASGRLNPIDEAWFEGSPGWKPLLSITGVIMPGGASSSAEPMTIAHPPVIGSTSYAGFWIRSLAFLIDSLILIIVYETIVRILLFFPRDSWLVIAIEILPILISGAYMTLCWSSSMQATPGQKVCGVEVINAITGGRVSFARALGRYLAL
jgi:hypothetical protein